MSIANIKTQIESLFATYKDKIETLQANYYASHGCYFQGIKVNNDIPVWGNNVTVDLTKKPTDQLDSWPNNFLLSNLPCTIEIFVEESPITGHGFSVHLEFIFEQVVNRFSAYYPGGTFDKTAWQELDIEEF